MQSQITEKFYKCLDKHINVYESCKVICDINFDFYFENSIYSKDDADLMRNEIYEKLCENCKIQLLERIEDEFSKIDFRGNFVMEFLDKMQMYVDYKELGEYFKGCVSDCMQDIINSNAKYVFLKDI